MLPAGSRYELKMVIPSVTLSLARMWIRVHPAVFSVSYPPRFVNNVYFDTDDLALAEEALGGVGKRVKVRVRWYGLREVIKDASLELKCKRGMVGWKLSHRLSGVFDLETLPWRKFFRSLRSELPDSFRTCLDRAPRIVLINRYRREYFESFDRKIRLTIDSNIAVYPQFATSRPNLHFLAPARDDVVLEVKAAPDGWQQLPDILNDFPVRVTKHSKYVRGAVWC